jgi:hypothetical protein
MAFVAAIGAGPEELEPRRAKWTARKTTLVVSAVAFNLLMYVWAAADMMQSSGGSLFSRFTDLVSDEVAVPMSLWTALVQLPAHLVAIAFVLRLDNFGVERTSLVGVAVPQIAYLVVSSIQTVGMVFGLIWLGKWIVRGVARGVQPPPAGASVARNRSSSAKNVFDASNMT